MTDIASHRFTFCNLIVPTETITATCPDGRIAAWWNLRSDTAAFVAIHNAACAAQMQTGVYFYDGFALALRRIQQIVEALDLEWQMAQRALETSTKTLLVFADGTAYKFAWTFGGFGCVTLSTDGSFYRASSASSSELCSYSTYVETIAIRYLRAMISLQLSVYYSTQIGAADTALRHAIHATEISIHCLERYVRKQVAAQKRMPVECCSHVFTTTDCWKKWLAAMVMAQAKYCISIREVSRRATTAALDCEHLLRLCAQHMTDALIDPEHRNAMMREATLYKNRIIMLVGHELSAYSLQQNDTLSMQIAVSILYWYAPPGDTNSSKVRQELTNRYMDVHNRTPTLLFNHATPIDRLQYSAELNCATWSAETLHLPSKSFAVEFVNIDTDPPVINPDEEQLV